MSFHLNTLKNHTNPDGSKTMKYQVYKNNKQPFTAKELTTLTAMILKKAPTADMQIKGHADNLPANAPVTLQGLNPERWRTLKAFGLDINIKDEDEYYNGKVQDESKFNKYYQAIITINKPK